MLVWFCIRAKLRAHTLRLPCLACPSRCIDPLHSHNLLKSTSTASPRTTTLASLVKGRWIDGKAQALILLLSVCDTSAFFIHQIFLPSRRRDCLPFHRTSLSPRPLQKNDNPSLAPTLPKPHYPTPRTAALGSLAKGSWIATRLLLIINCLAQRFKYI